MNPEPGFGPYNKWMNKHGLKGGKLHIVGEKFRFSKVPIFGKAKNPVAYLLIKLRVCYWKYDYLSYTIFCYPTFPLIDTKIGLNLVGCIANCCCGLQEEVLTKALIS